MQDRVPDRQPFGPWLRAATSVALLLAFFAAVPFAAAQRPGDFVVSAVNVNGPSLGWVDRTTGVFTTIRANDTGYQGLAVRPGHRSLILTTEPFVTGPFQHATALVDIDLNGKLTSLATFSIPFSPLTMHGVTRDQDGSWLLASQNRVDRYANGVVTRVATGIQYSRTIDVIVDPDTGDYFLTAEPQIFGPQALYRIDRDTKTFQLLNAQIGRQPLRYSTDVRNDTKTGGLIGATSYGLLEIARSGAILRTIAFKNSTLTGLTVDAVNDDIYVLARDRLHRVTRSGTIAQTWGPLPFTYSTGIAVWGMTKCWGTGAGTPNSTYTVDMDFLASPNATYCAAVSWAGQRPGIALGTRTIYINLDALFLATFCRNLPGFTTGFTGTTDARGHARATFYIPSFVPIGTHYTFAAVALDASAPDGLNIGNAVSVVVR